MIQILFLILSQFSHDFRNKKGERICEFCHSAHNSKGPFLINILPEEELKEKFKDFDYISLTCMNCHTEKSYLILLYNNVLKFYQIPETSSIFLGINYRENNHPIGNYVLDEKNREIKCTTCHDVHRKDSKFLLKDTNPLFCFECHFEKNIFSGKHSNLICTDCHKLHRGKEKLLRDINFCKNCHKFDFHFEFDNCINCHNPHKPEVKR